jgi:queuine/archaeosine tRNA-ribosyltransferase
MRREEITNQQEMLNNEIILNIHQLLAYPNDQSKYQKIIERQTK